MSCSLSFFVKILLKAEDPGKWAIGEHNREGFPNMVIIKIVFESVKKKKKYRLQVLVLEVH